MNLTRSTLWPVSGLLSLPITTWRVSSSSSPGWTPWIFSLIWLPIVSVYSEREQHRSRISTCQVPSAAFLRARGLFLQDPQPNILSPVQFSVTVQKLQNSKTQGTKALKSPSISLLVKVKLHGHLKRQGMQTHWPLFHLFNINSNLERI